LGWLKINVIILSNSSNKMFENIDCLVSSIHFFGISGMQLKIIVTIGNIMNVSVNN